MPHNLKENSNVKQKKLTGYNLAKYIFALALLVEQMKNEKMKKFLLLVISFITVLTSFSQTNREQTGWFFFLNGTKINKKWGLHLDAQVRSHDEWSGVKNYLFRPGITYYIKPNQNATLGYLLAQTYLKTSTGTKTLNEHRIWQQYIVSHPVFTGTLAHRFRLEQRFIQKADDTKIFAQRLRYFFRDVQPLVKTNGAFTKGPFVALQNELFFNVQNKDLLNGKVFDQNRDYIAAGARFSKKFDAELGYMNQFVKGAATNTTNNILQLALYTRF